MGVAIAEELANKGASVTLILGPSQIKVSNKHIQLVSVESADEMFNAATAAYQTTDIAILAAAVADYRPDQMAPEKIKKADDTLDIRLVKNKDILATLGRQKKDNQVLVGFALETNNELEHATGKMKAKNADMIVLNSLNDKGAGFGHDTNKVTLLFADGSNKALPLQSKNLVAEAIVDNIVQLRDAKKIV